MPPNPAVEPLAVSFFNSFFCYELDICNAKGLITVHDIRCIDPVLKLTLTSPHWDDIILTLTLCKTRP